MKDKTSSMTEIAEVEEEIEAVDEGHIAEDIVEDLAEGTAKDMAVIISKEKVTIHSTRMGTDLDGTIRTLKLKESSRRPIHNKFRTVRFQNSHQVINSEVSWLNSSFVRILLV